MFPAVGNHEMGQESCRYEIINEVKSKIKPDFVYKWPGSLGWC